MEPTDPVPKRRILCLVVEGEGFSAEEGGSVMEDRG